MAQDDVIAKYLASLFPPQIVPSSANNVFQNMFNLNGISSYSSDSMNNSSLMQHPFMFSVVLPYLSVLCTNKTEGIATSDTATQTDEADDLSVSSSPKTKIIVEEDVEEHFRRSLGDRFTQSPGPNCFPETKKAEAINKSPIHQLGNEVVGEPAAPLKAMHRVAVSKSLNSNRPSCPRGKRKSEDVTSVAVPSKQTYLQKGVFCTEVSDVSDHFRKALGDKWSEDSQLHGSNS